MSVNCGATAMHMSHSWVTSSANLANLTALLPVASKYVKFTRMKGV